MNRTHGPATDWLRVMRNESTDSRAIMRWMLTISVVACFIIMYFFFFPDAGRVRDIGVKWMGQ